MRKILFLSFFLLINHFASAQTSAFRCYITITLGDCVNCLLTSKLLLDIPKEFKPIIVFKNQHRRQAPKIVSDVLRISWEAKDIVISDSLFNLLVPETTPYSEVHIIDKNNFKFFKCSLAQLGGNNHLDKIKSLANIKKYETQRILPDSIIHSGRLKLNYRSGHQYIFAYDYFFSKMYVFNKSTKKLHTIIEGKDFDRKEIYKACFGDTTKYYERVVSKQKTLEFVKKATVGIENFLDDKEGNIYAYLNVSYAVDSLNSIHVPTKVIFAKWNEKGKHTYYKTIQVGNTFGVYDNGDYSGDLQVLNKKLYILPYAKKNVALDSTVSLLAEVSLDNKKNDPIKFKKVYCPSVFKKFRYSYLLHTLSAPYFFYNYYPEFTNFETGEKVKIQLGYEDKAFEYTNEGYKEIIFEIIGVIEKEDTFYALIKEKDDYSYISFNKKGQVLSKKLLQIPTENISRFVFTDKNELIAITHDNFLISIAL